MGEFLPDNYTNDAAMINCIYIVKLNFVTNKAMNLTSSVETVTIDTTKYFAYLAHILRLLIGGQLEGFTPIYVYWFLRSNTLEFNMRQG